MSVCTALSPSSERSLAYRRWHGALSTLHGASRGKGGGRKRKAQEGEKSDNKRTRNREREGLKKVCQRFWIKIKRRGGGDGRPPRVVDQMLAVVGLRAAGCAIVGGIGNSSSSGRSRSHTGRQIIKNRGDKRQKKEK